MAPSILGPSSLRGSLWPMIAHACSCWGGTVGWTCILILRVTYGQYILNLGTNTNAIPTTYSSIIVNYSEAENWHRVFFVVWWGIYTCLVAPQEGIWSQHTHTRVATTFQRAHIRLHGSSKKSWPNYPFGKSKINVPIWSTYQLHLDVSE